MNPSCVIAAHFVPPPGSDPWTGLRHDYSPTENFQQQWVRWNRACFGANSASRNLTSDGKIRSIVNNYSNMSFSMAPGLLEELARFSPNVYRRIQQADADSVRRWGHGNAMARPWQEVILPLLPLDRAAVQIDWGLEAFRHHFGRPAEGFCLPQDAVNSEILDLLVDRGLRYLLLSGTQAEGLMIRGAGSWQSLGGAPAPGDRPFQIDRPGGSLGVFFPDEALSKGLLQERLLRDSAHLEAKLRTRLQGTGFIHLSAPGATLGIDEPFADMCLAALWDRLGGASPVDCVNYGYILENRPPQELVKLKKGDDERGTSSRCPHGVGRWHRDCGCRSTETHQRWKQPLWDTFVAWEDRLTTSVDAVVQGLQVDPKRFRHEASRLLLGTELPREWARRLLGDGSSTGEEALIRAVRAFQWLQAFLPAALWDGDDPADTAARGGFFAALRVFDFVDSPLAEFVQSLGNIALNDGRPLSTYVTTELLRRRHGPRFSAALLLLDRLLRPRARYQDSLGAFSVADFTRSRHEIDDGVYRYTGQIRLHDRETDRGIDLEYLVLEDHREGVSLYLKDADSTDKPEAFDLEGLPISDRMEIVQLMGNDLEANLANETQAIFPLLRKSLVYARLLDVPPLPMARSLMELAVTRKILGMTEHTAVPDEESMQALEEELLFAKDFSLHLDAERLNERFSGWLAQALGDPQTFTSEPVVRAVERLLGALARWGFTPDITVAQALVYEALHEKCPELLGALEGGRIEALHELKRLLRLAALLWLDTSDIKDQVLDP